MPGAGSTEGLGTEFNLKIYSPSSPAAPDSSLTLCFSQVMETKDMLYIVTEYAKNGEMFGELCFHVQDECRLKSVDPQQSDRGADMSD